MFIALSRIGREQVRKERRSLRDCEHWETRIREILFPPSEIP